MRLGINKKINFKCYYAYLNDFQEECPEDHKRTFLDTTIFCLNEVGILQDENRVSLVIDRREFLSFLMDGDYVYVEFLIERPENANDRHRFSGHHYQDKPTLSFYSWNDESAYNNQEEIKSQLYSYLKGIKDKILDDNIFDSFNWNFNLHELENKIKKEIELLTKKEEIA